MAENKDEPFDVVDMEDLDKIEDFLMNKSRAAVFFPIDADYLANVSMHLLREVKMHRAKASNANLSSSPSGSPG